MDKGIIYLASGIHTHIIYTYYIILYMYNITYNTLHTYHTYNNVLDMYIMSIHVCTLYINTYVYITYNIHIGLGTEGDFSLSS